MRSMAELSVEFDRAISGGGIAGADRLCEACVDLLEVDGAAISLMHRGATRGTYGSSGELSRQLDELQFTFGEGPCLDAVAQCRPVLIADMGRAEEQRWPEFASALLERGIHAVFALPVAVTKVHVGALDLFRHAPGILTRRQLEGGLLAAEIAERPLLQLMRDAVGWGESDDGFEVGGVPISLARVEVYQATGMIMGRLGVAPDEALMRLRGYAIAHDMTASEVAWSIVERRLVLDDDGTGTPSEEVMGGPYG
jgi:hypothetical protein